MKTESISRREEQDCGEDIYSKVVRAGKRTYFFDVKSTRGGDYFLTITESRKKINADGTAQFDKNKIYLYKEDFEKYAAGLADVVSFIKNTRPELFTSCENADAGSDVAEKQPVLSVDEEFDNL